MERLRECVRAGAAIPDFYLSFLTRELAADLLVIADGCGNALFVEQVRLHLQPKSVPEVVRSRVQKEPQKHEVRKPVPTIKLPPVSTKRIKAPNDERASTAYRLARNPAGSPNSKGKSKKVKLGKLFKRQKRDEKPKAPPAPWRPPKLTLGKDSSLSAQKPTVFATHARKPFVYVGSGGGLPVQSDKAANLPYER